MYNHYDIQPMLADEEAFYVFMHARHMYEAVTRQVRQQRGAVTRGAMPDHLVAARPWNSMQAWSGQNGPQDGPQPREQTLHQPTQKRRKYPCMTSVK